MSKIVTTDRNRFRHFLGDRIHKARGGFSRIPATAAQRKRTKQAVERGIGFTPARDARKSRYGRCRITPDRQVERGDSGMMVIGLTSQIG